LSTEKIFIVDDELEIRRSLRVILVAYGYEVTDARSGEEAMEKNGGDG
jgi:CheY-like chemotaxis protein